METPLNEKESLAIIGSMIAGTRRKLSTDSVHYLLWGWSVLLAALAHFALLQSGYEHHYLPWAILMPATGIAAAIIGSRQEKQSLVKTHIDTAMTYLWLGFLVLLLLVLVSSVKMGWESTYPIIMWLYGLGTFVSGGILRFKPLVYGGIASWLFGVAALFVPFEQQLLLLAAAIICSYIVPGHLLKASKDV